MDLVAILSTDVLPYVVTNTTGVSYIFMISSKRSFHISTPIMFSICSNHYNLGKLQFFDFLSKWLLDLVCSVHIVTITTWTNFTIFLDLVCSVYVVTITTGVTYNFKITSESSLHISVPSMFCVCSNQTWKLSKSLHRRGF